MALKKKAKIKFIAGIALTAGCIVGAIAFGAYVGANRDTIAYNSGHSELTSLTRAETLAEGTQVSTEIGEEGTVLLKNEDNLLPLGEKKVTILGASSFNYVQGGTGSAGGKDDSNTAMMNRAFRKAGIDYNKQAWAWLNNALGGGSNTHNGTVDSSYLASNDTAASYSWTDYTQIREFTKETYEQFVTDDVIGEYNEVAVVTFARSGAEGASPSLDYDGNQDTTTGRVYLELSDNEIDLLKFCKEKFQHTVVLINSAVPMECGFLNNSNYNVDAALWIGHPGEAGLYGVANVLAGKVSPSGRTVDTWSYDMSTNPTYYSADNQTYSNVTMNSKNKYYEYNEGIYVGYRYYETADSEGYFDSTAFKTTKFKGSQDEGKFKSDTSVNGSYTEQKAAGPQVTYEGYSEVVQFPFGYGLSYTTFTQSVKSSSVDMKEHGQNSITVTVKNTGSVAGKEVVQIYMEAPYGNDSSLGISGVGLEKAKVVLVGYAKTSELEPGKSEDVTVEFSTDDLASFDEFGKGCYVLEKGEYTFHVAENAHSWANETEYGTDFGTVKHTLSETIVYNESGAGKRVGEYNGNKVEEGQVAVNQMNDITAGDGAMLINGGASGTYTYGYLSRKDFSLGMKEIMSYQSDDYTGVYSGNGYVWSADGTGTTALVNGAKDGSSTKRAAATAVKEQIETAPKDLTVDGVNKGKEYDYDSILAGNISFGDGKTSKLLYGYGNDAAINEETTYEGKSVDSEDYLVDKGGVEIKWGATYYVAEKEDGETVKDTDGYVKIYDSESDAAKDGTATKLLCKHMDGVPSDDLVRWGKLANELTFLETDTLMGENGWHTPLIPSIGKGEIEGGYDLATDGPGEAGNAQNPDCTWWPCACTIAATWNVELAEREGEAYGHQDLLNNTPYCYAPAMNTHRTPFGGRDFEYYSEDGVLAGHIGGHVVQGIQSTGMHVFIKHYALNDSDTNRGGVETWASEGSIREIYAKPFEISTKYYKADGIMGSLNSMGMAWAHTGFYQAMTRDEWGWNGFLLTDGDGSASDTYNNYDFWTICNQGGILGGGKLSANSTYTTIGTDGTGASNYVKYVLHNIGVNTVYQYSHNYNARFSTTTWVSDESAPTTQLIIAESIFLGLAVVFFLALVLPGILKLTKKKGKKSKASEK